MIWVNPNGPYVRPQRKDNSFLSSLYILHKFSEPIGMRHKEYKPIGPTMLVEWLDE